MEQFDKTNYASLCLSTRQRSQLTPVYYLKKKEEIKKEKGERKETFPKSSIVIGHMLLKF